MNDQLFRYAKEEIRKALVQDYINRNPGIREQDVILSCHDGELELTHLSAVMSNIQTRKHYSQGVAKANILFAEMPAHRNERWLDCVVSAYHSKKIIDCLQSSLLQTMTRKEWEEGYADFAEKETSCALMTVKIQETQNLLSRFKSHNTPNQHLESRRLLIRFLKQVIDQLKIVHAVFIKEVSLGDKYAVASEKFMDVNFPAIETVIPKTNMEVLTEKYKFLKENPKANIERIYELNLSALNETKLVLEKALDEIKKQLHLRRDQYEKIWAAIAKIQDMMHKMEDVRDKQKNEEEPSPLDEKSRKRVLRS